MRVRDEFSVELPMFRLFNSPTLAALAEWIGCAPRAAATAETRISRVARDGPLPLSFAQDRMWFVTQFEDEAPAYAMPAAVRMRGRLHVEVLRSALQSILDRHEILRVTYACPDGLPVQAVAAGRQVELPVVDLGTLAEPDLDARVQQIAREEVRRPFDLSADLPLRTLLLRRAANDHVLLLVFHHIVSDGWSKSIFFRELAEFYRAALTQSPADLPELPIQYGDYAVWQRRLLTGDAGARLTAYWTERLRNSPSVLDFPADRARPARQSYRGGIERLLLPASLAGAVRALSRAESVTPFMTLLAAFQTLLFRYSGQADIPVGTPVANRVRRETEPLIGLFVNVLVMRTSLDGDPSFRQLLARVRETALGAYDHQQMPLERLLEIVQPERSLSHSPLFQAMFQLRNFPEVVYELEGLRTEVIPIDPGTAQFELFLEVTETPDGLACALTYSSGRFDAASARRILGHYRTLLEAALGAPDIAVGQLPLLSAAERTLEMLGALLGVWKAGAAYVPLDPSYPCERLASILEDASPAALIAEARFRGALGNLAVPILDLAGVAPAKSGCASAAAHPDDLAFVIFTSGSTGRPKGVAIRHGGLTNCLAFLRNEIAPTPADVVLGLTTVSFDIAAVEMFLPLISGACVSLIGRDVATDGRLLARAIGNSGATILQATPATWQLLLESGWTPAAGMRIISGGEVLTPAIAARLLGCDALWNLYGPTETTIYSTGCRVRDPARASVIGRPIANTRAYVLDGNRQPMPAGVPGELYIGGDGLARGYWRQPDLTAERFVPDPFSSETGARLYRTGDRRLAVWFVPRAGHAPDHLEMRELLQRTLPAYMQPSVLVGIPALPLTPNGKVDTNALQLPESGVLDPSCARARRW